MEASMTMFRLGTALLLATLMTTGALARGGGTGMARGGFSQPMLPAPSIENSTPTLTGPVGPPPSSLSSVGLPAGNLYPK
jgi:hypothetical protein